MFRGVDGVNKLPKVFISAILRHYNIPNGFAEQKGTRSMNEERFAKEMKKIQSVVSIFPSAGVKNNKGKLPVGFHVPFLQISRF